MLDFPRWKVTLLWLVVAVGILLSIPSLIAGTPYAGSWPRWMPQYKINLGLDLAGGSHLLLEADSADALKQRLQSMEDAVQTELRRDPRIDVGDVSTAGGRISFMVRNPTQVDAAVERLRTLTKPVAEGRDERRARRRPAANRSGRNQGNHRRHRGRQPCPRRSAGRRKSRRAEEADRPDGAPRI
jgi:preprotein translocase subunit SecD